MVSTSNWPPLVAISVVTRWRNTFSSSVTHLTVMSGFLAVKSLVSPCIRIMSELLTVAIVSAVSACEGTETNNVAAPKRTPRTFLTVTSHFRVEHILTRWAYVHTGYEACQADTRDFRFASKLCAKMSGALKMQDRRALMASAENGPRGGLVSDQAID